MTSRNARRLAISLAAACTAAAVAACSSGGGDHALNPQPLPPYALDPAPLPPTENLVNENADHGDAGDGGVDAATE